MTLRGIYNCNVYGVFALTPLYYSDSEYCQCVRKAIVTLGRQPGSDVIVLSPFVHVSDNGEVIPFRDSKYVWVEGIKREGIIPASTSKLKSLPSCPRPLDTLLTGLQELTQSNFPSAVFVIGKG